MAKNAMHHLQQCICIVEESIGRKDDEDDFRFQFADRCSLGACEGKKTLDCQVDVAAALLEDLQVCCLVGEAHLL